MTLLQLCHLTSSQRHTDFNSPTWFKTKIITRHTTQMEILINP
jgi:hypothetical protein